MFPMAAYITAHPPPGLTAGHKLCELLVSFILYRNWQRKKKESLDHVMFFHCTVVHVLCLLDKVTSLSVKQKHIVGLQQLSCHM